MKITAFLQRSTESFGDAVGQSGQYKTGSEDLQATSDPGHTIQQLPLNITMAELHTMQPLMSWTLYLHHS